MTLLVESAVTGALLVAVVLLAVAVLKGRSAALRHWVLIVGLAAAALMPVFDNLTPAWGFGVPLRVPAEAITTGVVLAPGLGADAGAASDAFPPAGPAAARVGLAQAIAGWLAPLVPLWGVVVVALLARLAAGLMRLAWLARTARAVPGGPWAGTLSELTRRHAVRRPVRVLATAHPSILATWGWRRPVILLPDAAAEWPPERVRVVLAHELAHIDRGDWVANLLAEALRAIHWYNPLFWMAARRLREEAERACDDRVLELGVAGPDYAAALLDVARELGTRPRPWVPAVAMVHTSSLERRVKAMLNDRMNRSRVNRTARATSAAALVAAAVGVAGLVSAQNLATVSGGLFDAMNGVLPNATVVLTNTATQAKFEIRSDNVGRYEFPGVPPGTYVLQASLPGFATLLVEGLVIQGGRATRDMVMKVGSLEETITVLGESPSSTLPQPSTARARRSVPPCPGSTGGIPVGGNIRPPIKVRDVRPVYPESLRAAGIEGLVVLNAIIGTDGFIREATPVVEAHPLLAQAAVDAVRQWEFDETLLNCVPVEVSMRVVVNFWASRRVVRLGLELEGGQRPVLTLRHGQTGTIRTPELGGYALRAVVQPGDSDVLVLITNEAGGPVRRLALKAGAPPVPSGTNPPFQIAVLDVTRQ
ncbi:MAG: hypothetical protein FJW23_11430 [Acidimicrobiia bacterium]|nr:hypothetical protein [Acidimicrobiia bacterium]